MNNSFDYDGFITEAKKELAECLFQFIHNRNSENERGAPNKIYHYTHL